MKKITRMGFMAAATLLAVACSQEELVDKSASGKQASNSALSFSAGVSNMTRVALEKVDIKEFGVYAVKTTAADGKSLIMNNYVVKFSDSSAGSTWGGGNPETPNMGDKLSYWYYDGIKTGNGAKADQVLKYWDTNASKYDFYAYLGYDKNLLHVNATKEVPTDEEVKRWYNPVDYSMNYRLEASAIDTDDPGYLSDNYPLMAYTERKSNDNFNSYSDVPFAFKHFNSKVNIQFYTTITAYDVKITDAIVLRTATDAKINTKCLAVMERAAPAVVNPTLNTLSQNFLNPTPNTGDKLPTSLSKYGDGTSGTTYFCMPSSTESSKENGDLEVYVKYDLIQGEEAIHKEATITLAKETYTRWEQNKAYLYIFRITADTLHPIVFDGITVNDYEKEDFSHVFDINAGI